MILSSNGTSSAAFSPGTSTSMSFMTGSVLRVARLSAFFLVVLELRKSSIKASHCFLMKRPKEEITLPMESMSPLPVMSMMPPTMNRKAINLLPASANRKWKAA